MKSRLSSLLLLVCVSAFIVCAGCTHTTSTSKQTTEDGTRSSNTVTADEVSERPVVRPEELLKGRVAGVEVYQTNGGEIAVRIRGVTSIHGSNEPLYVVDGIPISPGPGGALTGINPLDIESIEVLKNPSETALYGVRGANGVILVTTKRGK